MDADTKTEGHVVPWNKGKLLGQKPPLKLKERSGLSEFGSSKDHRTRELALFNSPSTATCACAIWSGSAFMM